MKKQLLLGAVFFPSKLFFAGFKKVILIPTEK